MAGPKRPEFLERSTYRQRRLRDAARVLPLFAILLIFLPLLWPWENEETIRPSTMILYIFGLWVVLVGIAAALAAAIRFETDQAEEQEE